MAIVVYRVYPDKEGDTYNPVAFKLDNGEVKTTQRALGMRIREMSIDDIEENLNDGHVYKTRRYTDETALEVMRRAK